MGRSLSCIPAQRPRLVSFLIQLRPSALGQPSSLPSPKRKSLGKDPTTKQGRISTPHLPLPFNPALFCPGLLSRPIPYRFGSEDFTLRMQNYGIFVRDRSVAALVSKCKISRDCSCAPLVGLALRYCDHQVSFPGSDNSPTSFQGHLPAP